MAWSSTRSTTRPWSRVAGAGWQWLTDRGCIPDLAAMITADVMKRRRAFAVVLMALAVASCSVPLPTRGAPGGADALLLSLQFKAGETLHYGLGVTTDNVTGIGVQPQQFSDAVTADETDHVISVAGNGSAIVDVVVSNTTVSELPLTGRPQTMRVT